MRDAALETQVPDFVDTTARVTFGSGSHGCTGCN
jgi:hypothetical protein